MGVDNQLPIPAFSMSESEGLCVHRVSHRQGGAEFMRFVWDSGLKEGFIVVADICNFKAKQLSLIEGLG